MRIERRGVMGVGVCVDAANDSATVRVHTLRCCPCLIGGTAGRADGRTQP